MRSLVPLRSQRIAEATRSGLPARVNEGLKDFLCLPGQSQADDDKQRMAKYYIDSVASFPEEAAHIAIGHLRA